MKNVMESPINTSGFDVWWDSLGPFSYNLHLQFCPTVSKSNTVRYKHPGTLLGEHIRSSLSCYKLVLRAVTL